MSKRAARKSFSVHVYYNSSYDVACKLCVWYSTAWDYKTNALHVGYGHAYFVHGLGQNSFIPKLSNETYTYGT